MKAVENQWINIKRHWISNGLFDLDQVVSRETGPNNPQKRPISRAQGKEMNAKAVHAQRGDDHAVLVAALRVLVCREGDLWTAQGIEIDYAACGESAEDVQNRFERGLLATVKANLDKFGHIENMLKYAPEEVREEMNNPSEFNFGMLTVHKVEDPALSKFPFNEIRYIPQVAA